MQMRYYRIENDNSIIDRWFLTEPVTLDAATEIDFWPYLAGRRVPDPSSPLNIQIQRPGPELRFTLAGFDIPVVVSDLVESMAKIDPQGIQSVAVLVGGQQKYRMAVATRCVSCIDETKSRFTKWSEKDQRPDKVGQYRMFTRLAIDPFRVSRDVHIFRVSGWNIALVVSELMRDAMIAANCRGVVFDLLS